MNAPVAVLAACLAVGASGSAAREAEIATILAVGTGGEGNEAAAAARLTAESHVFDIPLLLPALDSAGPLAANWLRGVVGTVVDNGRAQGKQPSAAALEEYVRDTGRGPWSRQMAFELLRDADANAWQRMIPDLLLDPVPALRREPVAQLAAAGKTQSDRDLLQRPLSAAREEDQVREIASALRELGEEVDLPRHFGFLMDWKVAGPFESRKGAGFDHAYPPEETLDFAAVLSGKGGLEVRWQEFTGAHEYGMIDFNKPLGMVKEAAGYAAAVYFSPEERDAELRLGSKNAWKLWLNGGFVFGNDEYHRGTRIDHYIMPVRLRKGDNTILVKWCQNEQVETWTVEWEF